MSETTERKPSNSSMAFEVFRSRPFSLFECNRVAGVMGYQMQSLAVGWQVYDITKSPLDLGYVGLVLFTPAMLFSLIGGDVADRFNRRRVLLFSIILQALSALLLVGLTFHGIDKAYLVYPSLILLGLSRSFGGPAASSLLPHLISKELLPRAVAWNSSIWQLSTIVGPSLGGFIYAFKGAAGVYSASTVLSLLSASAVAAVGVNPPIPQKKGSSTQRLKAGLSFVWREKKILGTISLDLFAVLLGGAVAMLPVFARDILHAGPVALGIMRSAPALGATVTAFVLAYFPLRRKAGIRMFGSVAIFGIATVVFGISKSLPLSLLALFVMGASDMVSVVVRQTLVQLLTPEEMRGRVSAVNQLFIGASNELGEFESGLTAHWFGTVPSVIIGGIGTCCIVTTWLFLFPVLRKLDELDSSMKSS